LRVEALARGEGRTPTLLLRRSEVAALLDRRALAPALREAFVAYSAAGTERARRVRAALGRGTSTVLFPGTVPGVPAYTVKVHAKFPGEEPAIRGVLCLHDLDTGALLALMDSTHLTAVRTGLAGALAAHVLARPGAGRAAVIGAGVQGAEQLRSLAALRPLERASVYDLVPERARAFARSLSEELALPVEASASLREALRGADVVLSATWSREPFLLPGMLAPGCHVTSLGPDEPGKAEVAADVLRAALFVCDDRALAVEMGALGGVGLGAGAAAAELGEVLAGLHPGRTRPDEITVYGGVGLAFQDAVAAWAVYREARRAGAGLEVDLLA
jgi:ornithine cyclodeaminase